MKPYICFLLFICPALLLNCRTPGPTIETQTPKEEEIIQKKLQSELDEYLSERVFDTVNISKGITITSSDTDTTFKANADGIRTLDNSGNELTVFTDRGTRTKEMIVENQATICNTLIQDINNQTWFTRL